MNLLPVLHYLADGHYHSGQDLGAALGISRAAVWKQIHAIKELGVEIEAVTGKGYCIPGGIELWDNRWLDDLVANEADGLFRGLVDVHFTTGSTNADAMLRAHQGHERCLVLAEHQSGGRGRRGRAWVSPFGRNIYASMLWTFQCGIADLEGLSLVCALVLKRALTKVGCDQVCLKWPNDVLLDGRKLAGILLEITGDISGPCKVVMGVGVNLSVSAGQAALIDQPFSDLNSGDGKLVRREDVFANLFREWVAAIRQFEKRGFAHFRDEWMRADAFVGLPIEIRAGSQVTEGTCAGVDLSGRLLLDTAGGRLALAGGELAPSVRRLA